MTKSSRKNFGEILLCSYGAVGFIFIYTPIALLVLFSFNSSTVPGFPIQDFTLVWYEELWHDPTVIRALRNSLTVGVTTTILSTTIGTLAAFALVRHSFLLKGLFSLIILLPIIIPQLMVGIMLMILFFSLGFQLSLITVIIGHVVVTVPFVVVTVGSRLYGFDRSLESAAADLGATPYQTFRHVTLPIISPGIIAAALLVFTLSFDEFVVTFMTTGTDTTLPMYIWGMVRYAVTPKINALATLLMLSSLVLIFLSLLFMRRTPTNARRGKAVADRTAAETT